MKILELESSKGWGGQEKRTVRLNNNLSDEFEVFWGVEKDSVLFKRQEEIRGEFFDFKLNKIYNLKTIYQLVNFVKNKKIDIISTHSGKDAWIGNIVGKLCGVKVIRTRHLLTPIKSAKSYNLSDKVVCVSRQVKEYLESVGVKKEKLEVIYTGIDTDKFKPFSGYDLRGEYNINNDTVIIGIVAVLRAAKRHIDLLEAVKPLENIKIVIVGNGPQEMNIKNFIKENNLENKVLMLGHREDIDKILPNFDIFVLPSNLEALGTALLEAQSCGVPVVASRVGGIPECVSEGKTGFLFEKENVNDLREKLIKLIENKNLRYEFSKNAIEWIENNFSTQKMVKDTENLYKRIINE
ncbi:MULTISPECIES: glycosyltransferase family 4 protein [unclassified Lebetimonas]|uniref:glycosyltransferase family 4 protein n=1 Tax=unclassified Lebetimonas TaxID=2648158 RepID=UPI0004644A4E|nr:MULTISPECIES: glycosyltransferase family 4 protein [unclassified Lebetimonas]